MMVKENVPSTGYVGNPIKVSDLDYKVGEKTFSRKIIGGPDGATFVFAEDEDLAADNYYDDALTAADAADDTPDKRGQLAAAVGNALRLRSGEEHLHRRGDGPGRRGHGWAGAGDHHG